MSATADAGERPERPARPAARPADLAHAHADRREQQHRHHGIAGEVVPVTDPTRLAADARQFPVGVVEEIRHDQQQRAQIHPTIGPARERRRRGDPECQAHAGQMVGRDPACPAAASTRRRARRASHGTFMARRGRVQMGRLWHFRHHRAMYTLRSRGSGASWLRQQRPAREATATASRKCLARGAPAVAELTHGLIAARRTSACAPCARPRP